jgi:hypothetical protein
MPKLKLKFIQVHETNKRLAKKIVERNNLLGYNCEYIEKECSIEAKVQPHILYQKEVIRINRDTYFTEYKDEWEAWNHLLEKHITLELIPEQGENNLNIKDLFGIQIQTPLDETKNKTAYIFYIEERKKGELDDKTLT